MMNLTWYGNATVKISCGGTVLVTDPFILRNAELPPFRMADLGDVRAILVTHGHFDHVVDVPHFASRLGVPVFAAPELARNLMERHGESAHLFRPVRPGSAFSMTSLRVTPLRAGHIDFDWPLIKETVVKFAQTVTMEGLRQLWQNTWDHLNHPLGSCLSWHIEYEGKKLLHFGSLALHPDEAYPEHVDILSIAFQGNSRIERKALDVVDKIKPKIVYVHHFDDAFPPFTFPVPTAPFVDMMRVCHPDIAVIVPRHHESFSIGE